MLHHQFQLANIAGTCELFVGGQQDDAEVAVCVAASHDLWRLMASEPSLDNTMMVLERLVDEPVPEPIYSGLGDFWIDPDVSRLAIIHELYGHKWNLDWHTWEPSRS